MPRKITCSTGAHSSRSSAVSKIQNTYYNNENKYNSCEFSIGKCGSGHQIVTESTKNGSVISWVRKNK